MVLFTPCLLFSNIAPIIRFEKFLEFWPIPVFFLLFTFISWILCTTASPLFRVSKHYQRFVMGCVMFSNNNSLPVAIISSLAVSEAGKVLLLGEDDSPESVAAR
jgi:predicted permease